MDINFVSLDQSCEITGWTLWVNGIYQKSGVIINTETDPKYKYHEMGKAVFDLLNELQPYVLWMEDTNLKNNAKTLKDLSKLQGMIAGYCLLNDADYGIIAPSEWRKILGFEQGNKKRDELKLMAYEYVKEKYGLMEISIDEAESICIGEAVLEKFNRMK